MNKSIDIKREYINSALQRHPISSDIRFVSTISHLIQNDSNLDSVISDLNNYRNSFSSKKITNYESVEQWITDSIQSWKHSLFVTLTFNSYQGSIESSKNYECFKHRVSKDIFKNAYKRNKKLIEAFVVEEGDNEQHRRHLHSIMRVPEKMTVDSFAELIKNKWTHGYLHYYEMNGEKNRYIGYLLKDRSKPFSADVLTHF
jgi:hypothetical protein